MRRRPIFWCVVFAIMSVPILKVAWVVVLATVRFVTPSATAPLPTDGARQVVLSVPAMT